MLIDIKKSCLPLQLIQLTYHECYNSTPRGPWLLDHWDQKVGSQPEVELRVFKILPFDDGIGGTSKNSD